MAAHGLSESRKRWAEECGVGVGNKVGRSVMAHGEVTMLGGRANGLLEIQFPQSCALCARALKYKVAIVADVHGGGSERDLAASVAELPDGQEWLGG